MGFTPYKRLKAEGDKAESMFNEWLVSREYTHIDHIDDVYEEEGLSLSDWDIRCRDTIGIPTTFEVKGAFSCHEWDWTTIETVQNGKPGGLAVTKAHFFVHVNEKLGFAIDNTKKLRAIYDELRIKTTMNDYKKKKEVELQSGLVVRLWRTDYDNYACGFRVPNDFLTWYK